MVRWGVFGGGGVGDHGILMPLRAFGLFRRFYNELGRIRKTGSLNALPGVRSIPTDYIGLLEEVGPPESQCPSGRSVYSDTSHTPTPPTLALRLNALPGVRSIPTTSQMGEHLPNGL